ncbi:MAG: aspartate/glutamate/uridylate kinase [Gammaproteobacteria bacterium]
MVIVKLGGSLYSSPYLKEWCDQIASIHQRAVLIVPGGGPFADQVRDADAQWKLSEIISHKMAVMGMQQFGQLLLNINKKLKSLASIKDEINVGAGVWLPYQDVVDYCDYPTNWQTTSDSLALWLAGELSSSHLCLVKSANVIDMPSEQLINSDVVDDYFSIALKKFSGNVHFYHSTQANIFANDINNGKFD